MKIVVITTPYFHIDEIKCVTALFRAGLELLHLRKPQSSIQDCARWLKGIPEEYVHRVVLHDHFRLVEDFNVKGVHLNGRNPNPPENWNGHVSRSCHSVDELIAFKERCDYLFLSPIFDSISKEGYNSELTEETILTAKNEGFIDHKVYALGGMTATHLKMAREWGFGGAAFLGDVWNRFQNNGIGKGIEHFQELKRIADM